MLLIVLIPFVASEEALLAKASRMRGIDIKTAQNEAREKERFLIISSFRLGAGRPSPPSPHAG